MSEYHTKKYHNTSCFTHTRRHEVRIMKLCKKLGVSKSELLRDLIDQRYDQRDKD